MKGAVFFTTTVRHGHVRTSQALHDLLKQKSWPVAVATAEQVHKARIAIVPQLRRAKEYDGADGLLTDQCHQPLGVFTADCASIFLSAPLQKIVGVLHAGWRGVQQRILQKALRLLRKRWRCPARDVFLVLGPSIGDCCFEVGWDVARYFPGTRERQGKGWTVDLSQAIRRQAVALGIPDGHIHSRAVCTRHSPRYFSYRRDKTANRQVSLIMRSQHN